MIRHAVLAALLLSVHISTASAEQFRVRERLGARLGYVDTKARLDDSFGNGHSLTLFFTERIYRPLFLDIRIGVMYLGSASDNRQAVRWTGIPGTTSEMRLLFLTAGCQYTQPVGDRWNAFGGLSLGIYSTSVLFDTPTINYDISDQNFGMNASVGSLYRLAGAWNAELSLTTHYFDTRGRLPDVFYFFTGEGGKDPFILQFAAGVVLDLN